MPPRPNPKPALTHFLCIPLVTSASRPQLSGSLASFRADVTNPASFGIPDAAVRPLGTLHLTLGMMSFPNNEGIDRAVEVLQRVEPRKILADVRSLSAATPRGALAQASGTIEVATSSLPLTLKGLHSMQPAKQASVLYASPEDPQGVLQAFCERLRHEFLEAGVMVRDERPLLLHATIVNTIYAKGGRGAQGKRGKKLVIDATDVLGRYDEYVWMDGLPLERIAICKMGAKDVGGEEGAAYEVEAEIAF